MWKKFLLMKSVPSNVDLGLLLLRVLACGSLFLKHGAEKLFSWQMVYQKMAAHHTYVTALGIGPSLFCAAIADGICTLLIVLGLFTRWAAVASILNLFVAWALVNHLAYFGPEGGHGELIVAYIAVVLTLFLTGGGRYSVDRYLEERA